MKQSLTSYSESFQSNDPRYSLLLNVTMNDINSVLHEITSAQLETLNLTDNIHRPNDFRTNRSLLPSGRLFHFLFGTAKDEEVRSMKQDVKWLYDNQISKSKVLNDVISIASISRGLINENILKINQIISTITFLNDTMDSILNQLRHMFSVRRFLLLHTEMLTHHARIRSLLGQKQTDTTQIKEYLKIHIMGKLNTSITDPEHLRQEFLWISKQLPTRLSLPDDPHGNIWHYYRFLTVNPVIHGGKLVLMMRIPLIDVDSVMNLYKIYNLPIYNHNIGKTLQYVLEGSNLAITKDDKYAAILSDMEFIQCTLADGHFCALNTGLYQIDMSQWCVTVLFFKDNDKIDNHCRLALSNITGPQANYLDQGLWAISVKEPVPMEVKCKDHSHVKTLEPPFALMNLHPACSTFSSVIKLLPYFKRFSTGFHVALKSANLHIPKFCTPDIRIWMHFNLSNVTKPEIQNLRKLALAPSITINQLRAQISNFRCITSDTDQPWIYYVGGSSGSGLVLLLVKCCFLYWCCKRTQKLEARSPACVTNADPENPNMMHSRVGAIGTNGCSVPGQETVRIQDPVGTQCMVLNNDMQFAFASALLDQLEDYGTDVRMHHRRLRDRHHTAKTQIVVKPSIEIQDV